MVFDAVSATHMPPLILTPIELDLAGGERGRIRLATPGDAAGLVALDRALAQDGRGMVITEDQIRTVDEERTRLENLGGGTRLFVAEIPGRLAVAGSGELRRLTPTRCRHVGVLSLGVHPGAQRLGLGRALLERLIDAARSLGLGRLELYVRADNQRARALYESAGFTVESARVGFVRLEDGQLVDDLIMAQFL